MDPPFFGEWEIARTSDELVLAIRESDVFERALTELAGALDERGIAGAFTMYEPPPPLVL